MMTRAIIILLLILPASLAVAQQAGDAPSGGSGLASPTKAPGMLPDVSTRQGVSSVMKWITFVTIFAVAPAVVVMVTCFTRIIVVLGLLRQALGTAQLPPNQVLFGLALLMTVVVMAPVLRPVYQDAIEPYLAGRMEQNDALAVGEKRVKTFMVGQIEAAGNTDDIYLFLDEKLSKKEDLQWRDVPTLSIMPAYVLSELKVAFIMGFRIFLPFVIIDLLVASVLVSVGMLMVPPVLISLPFKLLLFVLADGWHLVVGTLMRSFGQL